MIAGGTKNRKVNKKPNSIQKETSETQFIFSDNQYVSESRSILDFKAKRKKEKLYKYVRTSKWTEDIKFKGS